jgi:hypothetical protein
MHSTRVLITVSALACLTGLLSCAETLGPVIIDGVATPRVTNEYVGRPYSIRHSSAYPKLVDPSGGLSTPGGTIAGTVCGADLGYQVTHNGDHVRVSGFIDNYISVNLQIREANHIRRITGGLGNFSVDVILAEEGVVGAVGRCTYHMRSAADGAGTLSERIRVRGYDVTIRFAGYPEFLRLPAADQAALLPLVLRCSTEKVFQHLGQEPPTFVFGGPLGAEPSHTIRFGPNRNRRIDCGL